MGCCIRTGMPEMCTVFCDGYGMITGEDYTPCIASAPAITQCFKEGHGVYTSYVGLQCTCVMYTKPIKHGQASVCLMTDSTYSFQKVVDLDIEAKESE